MCYLHKRYTFAMSDGNCSPTQVLVAFHGLYHAQVNIIAHVASSASINDYATNASKLSDSNVESTIMRSGLTFWCAAWLLVSTGRYYPVLSSGDDILAL